MWYSNTSKIKKNQPHDPYNRAARWQLQLSDDQAFCGVDDSITRIWETQKGEILLEQNGKDGKMLDYKKIDR